MRIDNPGDVDPTEAQAAEAAAPASAPEDCPTEAVEAVEPHDHARRATERPLMFASGGIDGAGMRARIEGLLSEAIDAAAAPAARAPSGVATTASVTEANVADSAAAAAPADEPALDGARAGRSVLRHGARGAGVTALQEALNAAGVDPQLDIDGAFGAATQAAVRRFQAQSGIQVDGVVGAETMRALDAARGFAPYTPSVGDAHVPHARGAGGTGAATGTGGTTSVGGTTGTGEIGGALAGDQVDRLIARTIQFESGGRYDAWNPDDNGYGISFGVIQFNQKVGGLPKLLDRMQEANPARFSEIFGANASNLTNESWVRGANLNTPDFRAQFREAGREPAFQQVQRDLLRSQYFDPAERMAGEYGIRSERGLAMLFDSSVQNGVGGTRSRLRQAAQGGGTEAEILERFAGLADRGAANGRRRRILNDPTYSDAPLATAAPGGGAEGPRAGDSGSTGAIDAVGATSGAEPIGLAGPIGPGTRVLMIGDSHSVGAFGNEFDRQLRATGATVASYGSAGSSPSWWLSGRTTRSGYVGRLPDGSVDRPNWRTPHATPRLERLIQEQRPDVLLVALGGNIRGLSPAGIRSQVERLAQVARDNGTRLVWVGPPERRTDNESPDEILRFNQILRDAVAPYGGFVDSAQYTEYTQPGGDGRHYSGAAGGRIARDWAGSVLDEIQERARAEA